MVTTKRICYAQALGDCAGGLNREHFISHHVLREIEQEGGKLHVVGFPHNNLDGSHSVSSDSLNAKVLCKHHNSLLSDVDYEGGHFFLAFYKVHNALLGDEPVGELGYEFDGPKIERWMLKFLCGLIASGQAGLGDMRLPRSDPPLAVLNLLFGHTGLPDGHGLYTKNAESFTFIDGRELALTPYVDEALAYPGYAASVRNYGFKHILCMRDEGDEALDADLRETVYRPDHFTFVNSTSGCTGTIKLRWPFPDIQEGFVYELRAGGPDR